MGKQIPYSVFPGFYYNNSTLPKNLTCFETVRYSVKFFKKQHT